MDVRSRGIRGDWAQKFKNLMHWPLAENIMRIDGKDKNSILILREVVGMDRSQSTHQYASELLRAAVVATVSALDRYLHDLVLCHSWRLLSRSEKSIPAELKKLALPVLATKRALEKRAAEPKSRPGHLVKQAIQAQLHREYTFQTPYSVLKAGRMLGVDDFWTDVAHQMAGNPAKAVVIEKLRLIVERRNQIVHEADLVRKTKAKCLTLREIRLKDVKDWIDWMDQLGGAIDQVVQGAV